MIRNEGGHGMSETVKTGGSGRNPAIDKIQQLNRMEIKERAVQKMEEALLGGSEAQRVYSVEVPIDYSRGGWKGSGYGNR
jgi:hypothetical protein